MSTIHNIARDYAAARATQNILDRARKMLGVQRDAAQSRSRHAYRIECWAHTAAVMALDHARDADQRALSELGQIRAESKFRFQKGGTASRSVAPIL
jgi:hypothetical protein